MGIAVAIFKVDTTFAQTFCHSSLLQCRLEAEQCVSQPSSLFGCSLTKLLANTQSAAPCSATPNYFWAPGLLLRLRGNYRTHTPLQNNTAEDCNITHDLLQLLETYTAVDLAHSCCRRRSTVAVTLFLHCAKTLNSLLWHLQIKPERTFEYFSVSFFLEIEFTASFTGSLNFCRQIK